MMTKAEYVIALNEYLEQNGAIDDGVLPEVFIVETEKESA